MTSQKSKTNVHEPVLVDEVLRGFGIAHLKNNARDKLGNSPVRSYIDATLGAGGHTLKILEAGCNVLSIEADSKMLKIAKNRLHKACPATLNKKSSRCKLVQGNFRDIKEIARKKGYVGVNGILFDLGVSTLQLTSQKRGFSFQNEQAPLDMRVDKSAQAIAAYELLNFLGERQLEEMFVTTMSRNKSKKLAWETVSFRINREIRTVGDFIRIINRVIKKKKGLHKATLPFLALRIHVNSELVNLRTALPQSFELLIKGGRLAVISFHSGEDLVVKQYFNEVVKKGRGVLVNKKPIIPGVEEVGRNPSSRSAKLRILEKMK